MGRATPGWLQLRIHAAKGVSNIFLTDAEETRSCPYFDWLHVLARGGGAVAWGYPFRQEAYASSLTARSHASDLHTEQENLMMHGSGRHHAR